MRLQTLFMVSLFAGGVTLQAQSTTEKTVKSDKENAVQTNSNSQVAEASLSLKTNKKKGPKYHTNAMESNKKNFASLRNRGGLKSKEAHSQQNLSSATAFKEVAGRAYNEDGKLLPKAVIQSNRNSGYNGSVSQK